MTPIEKRVLAQKIVAGLLQDFTDRRGLGQEWEQIDEEIQEEIVEEWTQIVEKELP